MARHKDSNWNVSDSASAHEAMLCVLMDIRDELKLTRQMMAGSNFCSLRNDVDRIERTVRRLDQRFAKQLPLRVKKKK